MTHDPQPLPKFGIQRAKFGNSPGSDISYYKSIGCGIHVARLGGIDMLAGRLFPVPVPSN